MRTATPDEVDDDKYEEEECTNESDVVDRVSDYPDTERSTCGDFHPLW